MKRYSALAAAIAAVLGFAAPAQSATAPDTTPHKVIFVPVEKDVRLEVLDWGGTGQPLIFLSGLGSTPHVFDKFVQRFTGQYHVYGITRRGFGASSRPATTPPNYSGDRLGDDVVAVIDALKIKRPVLVGHSIAGAELSSVGARYPEKVAGLVYLDAAYAAAFYAPGNPPAPGDNVSMDINALRQKVNRLDSMNDSAASTHLVDEMLKVDLPELLTDLRAARQWYERIPTPPDNKTPPAGTQPMAPDDAVIAGLVKNAAPPVPILAIYALPHRPEPQWPAWKKTNMQTENLFEEQSMKMFAAGNPKAKIIHIPSALHDVFDSDATEVERDMKAFMSGLPK
jgi:non-heme chloroperoxidase